MCLTPLDPGVDKKGWVLIGLRFGNYPLLFQNKTCQTDRQSEKYSVIIDLLLRYILTYCADLLALFQCISKK